MTTFEVGKFYKAIDTSNVSISRECKALMPNGDAILYSNERQHSAVISKDQAGFWEEVRIPRKVKPVYAAILEGITTKNKRLFIGSYMMDSKEKLISYYSFRRVHDIIEINYEEKL